MLGAPSGKFLYARGDLLDPQALLAYLRAGKYTGAMITPAHARRANGAYKGGPYWLYSTPDGDGDPSTPDSWLPSQYERTIAAFERIALEEGLRGYLADAETGWAHASRDESEQFARDLVESRKRTGLSVGVTTFPTHPLWKRGAVPAIAGGDVWLSLQMYAQRTLAGNKAILAEVKRLGWETHIPSVAAYWHPGPGQSAARSAEQWWAAYGPAAWPGTTRGAIVWYALPAPRGALQAAIGGWARYVYVPLVIAAAVAAALAVAAVAAVWWVTRDE